jgi:hypothetical protein
MNPFDIQKYGHLTVCNTIERLPDQNWETGGVCGVWSVKDIIGHLGAFEHILEEVLNGFLQGGSTPYMDQMAQVGPMQFNDLQADLRKNRSVQEVLGEYNDTQARVMQLVPQIPAETWRQAGTLPWYGMEYALDDYVVYAIYGHKREHCAQIDVFKDTLKLS